MLGRNNLYCFARMARRKKLKGVLKQRSGWQERVSARTYSSHGASSPVVDKKIVMRREETRRNQDSSIPLSEGSELCHKDENAEVGLLKNNFISNLNAKRMSSDVRKSTDLRKQTIFFEEYFKADTQVLCNYLHGFLYSGLLTHALNMLEIRVRSIDGKLRCPAGTIVKSSKIAQQPQVFDVLLSRLASISPTSEINCTFMKDAKFSFPLDIIRKIFSEMRRIGLTPSPSAYASALEALDKRPGQTVRIALCVRQLEDDGYSLDEVIGTSFPGSKSAKHVRNAVHEIAHYDDFNAPLCKENMVNGEANLSPILVQDLYKSPMLKSGSLHLSSFPELHSCYAEQIEAEKKRLIEVPSILKVAPDSPGLKLKKKHLSKLLKEWRVSLLTTFQELKKRERVQHTANIWKGLFSVGAGGKVYPFLCLLPEQEYVDIIINQLCSTVNGGDFTSELSYRLGEEVYARFTLRRLRDTGILPRLETVYKKYAELFRNAKLQSSLLPRQYWLHLEETCGLTNLEEKVIPWNGYWKVMIGIKLVEIMNTVSFAPEANKQNEKNSKNVPAVYNSYVLQAKKQYGMTVPHPQFRLLLKDAMEKLLFPIEVAPMLVPPRPWCGVSRGGLLVNQGEFMRSNTVEESGNLTDGLKGQNLNPIYDSLNVLGSVAWIINNPILDLQIKYFRNKGSKELSIPQPASQSDPMPDLSMITQRNSDAYRGARRKAFEIQKQRQEMHSLFMEAFYKLSIANMYKDKVIWFAHNIDFRGRFYPISRHLNYMETREMLEIRFVSTSPDGHFCIVMNIPGGNSGSDVYRSLFLFAEGRPLGVKGLEWLKIHCVNLTDFKKHSSMQDRLEYADEVIDQILSSADNPDAKDAWWKTSDKPWQTLAACIEIAAAIRAPDPTRFVSRLPVHQDGSCNGLQHYAALGRDAVGAQQVNLAPSTTPQDVYTGVARRAEELRKIDADRGIEIARVLDGFVRRKVVKQTVMTTVYGVTRYGGMQQIRRQLGYLQDEFPALECSQGANYLVDRVFSSITEMFSGARTIQHWLTQIADVVSKMGHVVDWMTPLNLPVSQPYYMHDTKYISSTVQRLSVAESLPSMPNCRKQVNGFPPNFVHSLDSTHMMLTALYCHREGITFASVHDCFWSHACNVDKMGKICRQQFIALHSQPILRLLAEHFRKHVPNSLPTEDLGPLQAKLRKLLDDVPAQGNFNLNKIMDSTFFFS